LTDWREVPESEWKALFGPANANVLHIWENHRLDQLIRIEVVPSFPDEEFGLAVELFDNKNKSYRTLADDVSSKRKARNIATRYMRENP
jgi:hypothetical protein